MVESVCGIHCGDCCAGLVLHGHICIRFLYPLYSIQSPRGLEHFPAVEGQEAEFILDKLPVNQGA